MSDTPLWISFIQPTATVSAAGAVAYYAHQQWKLAQDKLRLDLFEKRYKVFDATRTFLAEVCKFRGNFDDSALMDFDSKSADAEFLFGPDVVNYIRTMRVNASSLRYHHQMHRPVPKNQEELDKLEKEYQKLLEWFVERIKDISEVFYPYLGYGNIRGGR